MKTSCLAFSDAANMLGVTLELTVGHSEPMLADVSKRHFVGHTVPAHHSYAVVCIDFYQVCW